MGLLEELNACNDMKVYPVEGEEFKPYGRVLTGYDFSDAIKYMEDHTDIPESGNCYVASVPEMEALPIHETLEAAFYGGMQAQIGYCNGRNDTFNGFEYHKGSEINVAVTDFMLSLGHTWEIKDNHYDNKDAKVFFVPKGTVIEMYQTTLHLSPLRVVEGGFKGIVVLPRGTNTPLSDAEKEIAHGKADGGIGKVVADSEGQTARDPENRLLLQRNKWVISHPDRKPLMDQGAFGGIIGENTKTYYPGER